MYPRASSFAFGYGGQVRSRLGATYIDDMPLTSPSPQSPVPPFARRRASSFAFGYGGQVRSRLDAAAIDGYYPPDFTLHAARAQL
jgi:hypothetical protein